MCKQHEGRDELIFCRSVQGFYFCQMMKKNLPSLLLLVTALLLMVSGCRNGFDQADTSHVFRYNEAADITSLDPSFARDQANIWPVNQIFNGLVQLNDNLEVIPAIASRWDISGDGLQYTFHLRKDVRFQDDACFPAGIGRKVNSQDVIYSFRRIMDPATASPGSWVFGWLDKKDPFRAVDDSTLVIRLKEPFPPFLGILTTQYCSVVPEEAVKSYGTEFRRHPVGTGPFCFAFWKEGVKLVLKKNPAYFEFENGKRLPYLDGVAITFLADKQSAFLEFAKGKTDLISGIDPAYKDELLTKQGTLNPKYAGSVQLTRQPYLNTEYLAIMVDPSSEMMKDNPLRLKQVRQAINLSFDRTRMIAYLRNNIGAPGVYGLIPPGLPGCDTSKKYGGYDPERAAALLAQAGFPGGKGLPSITLSSTSDYLDICKYIQFQVSSLGIDLKIEVTPPAALKEMKAQAKLPFFRASWIADYPDAESYLSLFVSGNFCPSGPNYSHFSNTQYDRWYREAMTTTVDSLRYKYYRQMEELMMNETPVIILYYDEVLRFTRKNVSGLGSNPMNLLVLKRVKKG